MDIGFLSQLWHFRDLTCPIKQIWNCYHILSLSLNVKLLKKIVFFSALCIDSNVVFGTTFRIILFQYFSNSYLIYPSKMFWLEYNLWDWLSWNECLKYQIKSLISLTSLYYHTISNSIHSNIYILFFTFWINFVNMTVH